MLVGGLSGLLFFSVERHLDFRQGKLNASSGILTIRGCDFHPVISTSPVGLKIRNKAAITYLSGILNLLYHIHIYTLYYICAVPQFARMRHEASDSFVAGRLVHRPFPLRGFADSADKRRHFAGKYRRHSLLPQSKFLRHHNGRGNALSRIHAYFVVNGISLKMKTYSTRVINDRILQN